MIPELPIAKPHLTNQKVHRRRGRPSKFGRGLRVLSVPLPDAYHIALEMLASFESPAPGRTNHTSARALEYARDVLEQFIADRFEETFRITVGEFVRRLDVARLAGVEPQFAIARVLANARTESVQ